MDKIEKNFAEIVDALSGGNVELKDTPKRMAQSFREFFNGVGMDASIPLQDTIASEFEGVVMEKGVEFYSMCEHHFLPFFGELEIAYFPNKKITGFGNIIKAFEILAHRPQLQERLTEEFADLIDRTLQPHALFVKIKATHLCMTIRGSKKASSEIITSTFRGDAFNTKVLEVLGLTK